MCGLQVCYYRDKNSINKFQIAKVTTEGIDICEPFALETNWDLKVRGLHQHTNMPNKSKWECIHGASHGDCVTSCAKATTRNLTACSCVPMVCWFGVAYPECYCQMMKG